MWTHSRALRVNLMLASKMLEKLGLKSDVANDGFESLKLVEQKRYDLIFMVRGWRKRERSVDRSIDSNRISACRN